MNTNKSKIAKNYFGQDTGTVRWLIHLNNEADDIRKSKCLCQSYLELTKQYSGLMKCLRLFDCHRIPIVGIVDLDNIIYWSAIKKLYPDLYNVYMNDTQDLISFCGKYNIKVEIYSKDNEQTKKREWGYILDYEDIPQNYLGALETGRYFSRKYENILDMIQRVITTIFGLIFLKLNYE